MAQLSIELNQKYLLVPANYPTRALTKEKISNGFDHIRLSMQDGSRDIPKGTPVQIVPEKGNYLIEMSGKYFEVTDRTNSTGYKNDIYLSDDKKDIWEFTPASEGGSYFIRLVESSHVNTSQIHYLSWKTGDKWAITNHPLEWFLVPADSSDDIEDGGVYTLLNKESKKAFGIPNASKDDGVAPLQWDSTGADDQKWKFEKQADGYYFIRNFSTGKILDVWAHSQSDGGDVKQYRVTNTDNQKWKVEKQADGSLKITAKHSGKVLGVKGNSLNNGATLHQYTDTGSNSQRWTFTKA
ncbi:RICIN domain-containing protein [Priestia megaterium]|uniref:RICIN domain-containing protein n=1 Tax=Priestia megaterium TaxID=1404 RepID=UPI0024536BFB|nr:RICIN domain-containing protein [Priestia megaterium]MDH3183674.1 RICIN domain-containing protein [Priestia megaterium]